MYGDAMTTYEWNPGDVAEIFDGTDTWIRALLMINDAGGRLVWRCANGRWLYADDNDLRVRPVFTLDHRDPLAMEALRSAIAAQSMTQNVALEAIEAAVESLLPTPIRHSCIAHGNEECVMCSMISGRYYDPETGECSGCSAYGSTGMHWDTCSGRIGNGPVWRNREDAKAGQDADVRALVLSSEVRAINAEERIALARHALVQTGCFTESEVSDDIAPRITEIHSAMANMADRGPDVRGMVVAAVLADDVAKPSPRRRFYYVGNGKWSEILTGGALGSTRFAWSELDDVTQGSLDGIGGLRP